MKERTIIIVWKWSIQRRKNTKGGITIDTQSFICDFIGENSKFEIQTGSEDSFFSGFTKNNIVEIKGEPQTPEYNDDDIINFCKEKNKNSKVLLFLHTSEPDEFSEKHDTYKECQKLENVKVFTFGGGKGIIYEKLLEQTQTYFKMDAIENAMDKEKFRIKKEHFDFIWNYYWNSLEKQQKIYELLNESKRDNSIINKLYKVLIENDGKFKSIEKLDLNELDKIKSEGSEPQEINSENVTLKYNKVRNWLATNPGSLY